jgi:hypothetical protein
MSSCAPSAVAMAAACRTLGFTKPPASKRLLRKRFLELAKANHPDRARTDADVATATRRMADLTEAYRTLQLVCDPRKAAAATASASGGGAARAGAVDPNDPMRGCVNSDANPLERDDSPEARHRREVLLEQTWLPWLRRRREAVPGARPLAPDAMRVSVAVRAAVELRARWLALSAGRWLTGAACWLRMAARTWVPQRALRALDGVAEAARHRTVRAIQAARFVVLGKT